MSSLKDDAVKIEKMLRLRTFVLGLQFFEKAEDLEKIDKLRRPKSDRTLCQVLTMARTYGWTIGMTLENFIHNSTCPAVLGLYDRPDFMRDGSYKGAIWFKDKKNAKKYEDSMPVIPSGKFNALAIGPVTSTSSSSVGVRYFKHGAFCPTRSHGSFTNVSSCSFHVAGSSDNRSPWRR